MSARQVIAKGAPCLSIDKGTGAMEAVSTTSGLPENSILGLIWRAGLLKASGVRKGMTIRVPRPR